MIYIKNDYLCSVDDSMDSAVRMGIIKFTKYDQPLNISNIKDYEFLPGLLVRCPDFTTASNHKNFTRDNMMPLIAGLYAEGHYDVIKRVFYSRFKSFFFMQNTERDEPGSRKLLVPHYFYKDSNPIPTTYPFYYKHYMEGSGTVESRIVDGPDPLLPNHIWFLIKAARLYYLYPFAIIGIPFYLLTLLLHSIGKHNEENQMITESYVLGTWALKLYKLVNKKWKERSEKYWTERGEIEYHKMIVRMMEKV